MRPPDGAISLAQAARLSGYHQDYLGQLARAGKLTATKIGRTWFTTEGSVRDFLRSLQGTSSPAIEEPTLITEEPAPQASGLVRETIDSAYSSGPQIIENVVISEVAGLPIALRAKPFAERPASLDSVITRVRLQQVQRDLTDLTHAVEDIAEQVSIQATQLQRLETVGTAATFKHSYVPNLEAAGVAEAFERPREFQPLVEEPMPMGHRILVVSGSMLAIAIAFIFVTNSDWTTKFFGSENQSTSIIYNEPTVAGESIVAPAPADQPVPTVTNSNTQLGVPAAPSTPSESLGGVEAGELLQ